MHNVLQYKLYFQYCCCA